MLKIRTKLLCLVLATLLLALLAVPIGGMVSPGYITGDDFRPALSTDAAHESQPGIAIACNGGSNGQCGG